MRSKITLSIAVLIFLFSHIAFANILTVTSNADAGPGSLREALANAQTNGTTVADTITFNLPGSLPSDRTIRLKSYLPPITSNTVIDGTTQPGAPFGVSDARIIIEPDVSPVSFNALTIAGDYSAGSLTTSIEIYGLYIRNFAQITNLVNYNTLQGSGIYIQGNSSGIKIGAPGKGNVICGNINAIYSYYDYYSNLNSGDVTIQSNIIGLTEDGKTANSNINGINVSTFNSITIGGDGANMGNVIAANVNCINLSRSNYYYYLGYNQSVNIKNNKIGTDYTGTVDYKQNPLFLSASFIKTYGIDIVGSYSASATNVNITGNIISGQIGYGVFISTATYSILNNKIGTDITGTLDLGNYEGIHSDISAAGTIGGPGGTDKNYIGHNIYGVEVLNSSQALITQNSIFCNSGFGIGVTATYPVPYVQVLTFHSNLVAGVATPNCAIELFYSDDCGNVDCQGKTYITTVQSDASGKWSYSGTLTGTVIATATTAQKNTSPFSALNLLPNEPVVKQYTCSYAGSVTIPQVRDGILFHWDKKNDDGTLTPLADTQNIDQLLPGIYQLTIQYPGGCQKVTQTFEIKDQRVKIQNIIPPVPQCRQKTFPVSANYSGGTGNVIFSWVNDQNVIVASGNTVSNTVPGGKYVLKITDDASCSVVSDTITIVPKPGPDYDLTSIKVRSALCGEATGSITGIKTSVGIGTLTYQWTNSTNTVVGTDKDLINVPGGAYILTLFDQSQCSPYSTSQIVIGQTNSVFINGGSINPAKCGLNNGAINVPLGDITNASAFKWYGPNGAELTAYQNMLSLSNLAEGNYTLVATNPITGCSNSALFIVKRIPLVNYSFSAAVTPATCNLINGGIVVTFNGYKPFSCSWTNQSGQIVSRTTSVLNTAPDTYTLSVVDSNGCANVALAKYTVLNIPLLAYDATNNKPVVVNDQCDESIGSITGIAITGGVPPYKYNWVDANGKTVSTDQSLTNTIKGKYTLTVTDQTTCAYLLPFMDSIGNDKYIPPAPVLSNQRICVAGPVTLYVKNTATGLYKLYLNNTDVVPYLTSTTGQFTLNVAQTSDYFVTYNVGSCESERTPVHVEVILVDISMANTFTPNFDGKNDTWKISGLERFPGATVQIFNRSGKKIFESKDYPKPFDGTYKGQPLPNGSYYYIININAPCTLISGNLTLVR